MCGCLDGLLRYLYIYGLLIQHSVHYVAMDIFFLLWITEAIYFIIFFQDIFLICLIFIIFFYFIMSKVSQVHLSFSVASCETNIPKMFLGITALYETLMNQESIHKKNVFQALGVISSFFPFF